ncbi:MAG: efflux RND transporter permease subunit [Pirellulaceae bacterium]
MHPIEAFVRNPVKVAVGVLLVALFGFIALLRMPMQLTPEVEIPTISIETRWPGASPQEVEREIIQEQEEYLKSVEGVTKMSSEAKESIGTISLEFAVGTNLEEAVLKVNTNLQQVPVYPEDADQPVIRTSDANSNAIAWFILSARMTPEEEIREFQDQHPELRAELDKVLHSRNLGLAMLRLQKLYEKRPEIAPLMPPDVDVPKMRQFAEDQIEAQFERVKGVSNSNVLGGLEPELQVVVDPYKLSARRLTIQDVRRVLREENKDTSGGDVWEGKRKYVVRTLGQFDSPADVEKQLLAVVEGEPVYVRDVAVVRESFKKPDGFVRRYGTSCIAINAQRETGANVLNVMEGLRETNERLNNSILKDRSLVLTQVYDETEYINSAVGLVNQNIILGGALTVIVLMLFLHLGMRTLVFAPLIALSAVAAVWSPWLFVVTLALILGASFWYARGALVVALAIPTSIIGTFLVLHLLDRSLNVISLAGLSFAVGMLVDNAVVVLENIYRRYEMGEDRFVAAERATKEVWGAVVASTLTTLAVFLPVLFVEQEAGQLFRDIALAISAAVGLSLLVSVTVIPTAAARILQRREALSPEETERRRRRRQSNPAAATVSGVVALNAWVLRGTLRKIAVIVVLVASSAFLAWWFMPKVEYLPNGNRNLIICLILPPPGYNVEQLGKLGEEVEAELRPYWDIDPESPEAAELDYPVINDFFYVARDRQVFLGLRAADPSRTAEILKLVADKFQRPNPEMEKKHGGFYKPMPGTFVVAFQSSLFSRGLQGGRTVDVEITGPDLRKLVGLGGRILGQVVGAGDPSTAVVPNAQVRPVPSLDLSSPELHVVPKLVQSRDMGVSASELGYMVDALNDGAYATDYYTGGDKIDLVILGAEQFAQRTQDLEQLPVATPNGQVVPLMALADVKLSSGPEQVNHRERQRAITIQVTPPENVALETAIADIEAKILAPLRASGQLGDEYTITMSGTADKLNETWLALRWNLVLALLITYLLMAALFESWTYPLVIILSVPLGAVGGVLGLQLLNWYLMLQGQAGQSLDVLTMLGFVILIGTVVNNAILIVHQSLNYMRDEFMDPQQAVLESVRSRIRPIFMTTTTTVFGLMPLVLFPGAGSELYRGLGSVVLGGLLVSTIFTLVLVPAMFSLMMDVVSGLRRLAGLEELPEVAASRQHHAAPVTTGAVAATAVIDEDFKPQPAPAATVDPFEDTVSAEAVGDDDTEEHFLLEDDHLAEHAAGDGHSDESNSNGDAHEDETSQETEKGSWRSPK